MTADASKGFLLSALLHGSVVALMFVLAYVAKQPETVMVFELVAGEGDNYGAKVAPTLGVEGGLKISMPAPPTPEPPRAEPVQVVEPAPVAPAPKPKQEVKPTPKDERVPDFAKQMKQEVKKAENKAKRDIAKERAAEEKRQAEEKKRISKAEFDAKNKVASAAPTKAPSSSSAKIQKVDVDGIAKGVAGGSSLNKVGGQGGKALKSDNDDQMLAFFGIFKDRVRKNFEAPPGLSDSLEVEIEFVSHADGTFSGVRVARSSGSKEFDDAVLLATRRIKLSPRPDKKTDTRKFTFAMSDREDR